MTKAVQNVKLRDLLVPPPPEFGWRQRLLAASRNMPQRSSPYFFLFDLSDIPVLLRTAALALFLIWSPGLLGLLYAESTLQVEFSSLTDRTESYLQEGGVGEYVLSAEELAGEWENDTQALHFFSLNTEELLALEQSSDPVLDPVWEEWDFENAEAWSWYAGD